jgi:hypothetical protein
MNNRPVETAVLRRQSHPIITSLPTGVGGLTVPDVGLILWLLVARMGSQQVTEGEWICDKLRVPYHSLCLTVWYTLNEKSKKDFGFCSHNVWNRGYFCLHRLATDWPTGRSRFDPRKRRKDLFSSPCVQTGSGAHPVSCTMGTGGPFPGGKARPGRDADHPPHLVQRSRMRRSYSSSPPLRLHTCVVGLLWFCTVVTSNLYIL